MANAQLWYIDDFSNPCTHRIVDGGDCDSRDETIRFILSDPTTGTWQRWLFCDSQVYKDNYKYNALILSGTRYEPKEGETAKEFMNRIRVPLHNAMMSDIIDTTI